MRRVLKPAIFSELDARFPSTFLLTYMEELTGAFKDFVEKSIRKSKRNFALIQEERNVLGEDETTASLRIYEFSLYAAHGAPPFPKGL